MPKPSEIPADGVYYLDEAGQRVRVQIKRERLDKEALKAARGARSMPSSITSRRRGAERMTERSISTWRAGEKPVVLLACLGALAAGFAAGIYYARRQATPVAASATVYVYGRAVDASGGLVAGVRVELGTQSSTTNASGQWGVSGNLVAGATAYLYVFPAFESVELPAGIKGQAPAGNVVTFTVPNPVPAQIGPFVVHMAAVATLTPTFTNTPTRTPTPTEWIITQTPTPFRTSTPPLPPTETPTPGGRPTPWWMEGLKPGFYEAPAFVQRMVLLDLYQDWGWDWDDCFYKFAAVYNLGLPCGPLVKQSVCYEGECATVRYQLWGKGDLALIADEREPCLVGVLYMPDNGDANWHEKGTVTP